MKLKELTAAPFMVIPAVISSVDTEALTAVVKPSSAADMNIRLKAGEDESGEYFVTIPRVGSTVLVGLIMNDEDEGFLIQANEIDKVLVNIGDKSLTMTKDELLFNGGLNGGLINIEQLKIEYNKTKDTVDAILSILTGAPINEPGNGLPSAFQAALGIALAGKETGSLDAVEDETIKH